MKSEILTTNSIIDGEDGRCFVCAVIFSLIGLFASTSLLAQYDSAQINGTVRDQSGAVIPNATVQIQNRDTGLVRQTVTFHRHLRPEPHTPGSLHNYCQFAGVLIGVAHRG